MKHFVAFALFASALALGGCSGTLGRLEAGYTAVTTATVTPGEVRTAIDAFDLADAGATNFYLPLHRCTATRPAPCRGAAKPVLDALYAGRSARNNLKAILRQQIGSVPSTDYNALAAATSVVKGILDAYKIQY